MLTKLNGFGGFFKEELPQFLSNWRTVPRLMMVLYGLVFYETMTWFMALPEPNNAQAGFVSVVVVCSAGLVYMSTANQVKYKSKD